MTSHSAANRCGCWGQAGAYLHSGHCCFRDDDQIGPVYCHRVLLSEFPEAPAHDMPPAPVDLEGWVGGQLVLLPDVGPCRRSLVPVPAQDAARPIVDLVVTGDRL